MYLLSFDVIAVAHKRPAHGTGIIGGRWVGVVIARLPTGRSSADTAAPRDRARLPRTHGTPARDERRARRSTVRRLLLRPGGAGVRAGRSGALVARPRRKPPSARCRCSRSGAKREPGEGLSTYLRRFRASRASGRLLHLLQRPAEHPPEHVSPAGRLRSAPSGRLDERTEGRRGRDCALDPVDGQVLVVANQTAARTS
jgi:hypothetical protein